MVEGKGRESWEQVTERTVAGIAELGKFTDEETALVREMQEAQQVLPSGRWLWTGGTEWLKDPKNLQIYLFDHRQTKQNTKRWTT